MDDILEGWVVLGAQGRNLLGKFYEPPTVSSFGDGDPQRMRGIVMSNLEMGRAIELCPAFDFIIQIANDQRTGAITKHPVCLPYDMSSGQAKFYVVGASTCYFPADFVGEDRKRYEDIVGRAQAMSKPVDAGRIQLVPSLAPGFNGRH